MEVRSLAEFVQSMRATGVEPDPQWHEAGTMNWLHFVGGGDHRMWIRPEGTEALQPYVAALLRLLEPWKICWLVRREGAWDYREERDGRQALLKRLGVKPGCEGVLGFEPGETQPLIEFVAAHVQYGWSTLDDLWIVPEHGWRMLLVDHHEVVHLECADPAEVPGCVAAMAAAGYALPTAPPDSTFRWFEWMGPEPEGWRDRV